MHHFYSVVAAAASRDVSRRPFPGHAPCAPSIASSRAARRVAQRLFALVLTLALLTPQAARAAVSPAGDGALAHLALSVGLVGAASLLDEPLYEAARDASTPGRDAFFGTITHLGDGLTALAVTSALSLHDPKAAARVGSATLRAGLAAVALKSVISRARPYEDPALCAQYRIGVSACTSMPSGHTAVAFSMAGVLAHEFPEQKWLWYALAALVGWSRVETDNHWPSDVVAGALLGLWAAETVLKK